MTFSRVKAHVLEILIYYVIYLLNTFTKIIYLHEVYLLFKFINYLNFSKWILNPCLYIMNYFNCTIWCFICFIISRLLTISFIWSIFPLKLIKQIFIIPERSYQMECFFSHLLLYTWENINWKINEWLLIAAFGFCEKNIGPTGSLEVN